MKWVESFKTVGVLSGCCHAAQGRGRFQGQIARHCTECEATLRVSETFKVEGPTLGRLEGVTIVLGYIGLDYEPAINELRISW